MSATSMSATLGHRSTIGSRLDRLPFSSFHTRVVVLIALGLFIDVFDIYLAGGVLAAMVKDGWSTMSANASFISATFLGMVVGSYVAGVMGDRYGRRFSYQFNLALFGLASIAAAFAPSMTILVVLRFVMGMGLGAEIVVGYATLAEFVPARSRGRWMVVVATTTNSALAISSLISLWVIPNLGWRAMFAGVGIAAMALWVARKGMPESPRWLESKGRYAEADAVVSALEAEAAKRGPLPPVIARPVVAAAPVSIWVLFSKPVIRRTMLGILINIVLGFGLYGFVQWVPSFLVHQGLDVSTSLAFSTILSFGGPVGSLIALAFADRIRHKTGIVGASIIAAIMGCIFPFTGGGALFLFTGFCLVCAIYANNAFGFVAHVPELFPTEYRLRGAGLCITVGRLATSAIQFAVVAVFAWGGFAGVVIMLSLVFVIQAVLVGAFDIDTKQRALEDIAPEVGLPDIATAQPVMMSQVH
jgi:putative MFS transporter